MYGRVATDAKAESAVALSGLADRRCGLASKMFSVAESFANQADYDDIYLHTHKNLDGALKFWTKMGCVVVLDSNDELETVHMDKQIKGLELNPLAHDFKYAVKL